MVARPKRFRATRSSRHSPDEAPRRAVPRGPTGQRLTVAPHTLAEAAAGGRQADVEALLSREPEFERYDRPLPLPSISRPMDATAPHARLPLQRRSPAPGPRHESFRELWRRSFQWHESSGNRASGWILAQAEIHRLPWFDPWLIAQ